MISLRNRRAVLMTKYSTGGIRFSLFFACICFLLTACDSSKKKAGMIFILAKEVIEQDPDSALTLLEGIVNPYELSKAQHAQYILLSVQAKDKAYRDIAADSIIFRARDYFQKKNDLENLALATFYCGRVLQSQEKFDEATKTFLEAKRMAEETKNLYLRGFSEFFIGELNFHQFIFSEAVEHYKKAATDFSLFDKKYKNQITSYLCIGNSFLLNACPDSAFFYYNKGLKLAEQHNDSILQVDIIQNIGVAYLESENADQAKALLRQSLPLTKNNLDKAKIYKNLTNVFLQENRSDSALFYAKQSVKLAGDDDNLMVGLCRLLSEIEESMGNYQKSLEYYKLHSGHLVFVLEEKENYNILDIQKKYDFELLQSANRKLVIERMWILVLSIILLAITIFMFYRNRTRNKEGLLTAKRQIYQLREMVGKKGKDRHDPSGDNEVNSEINEKLRDILFKQLDTFKKISLLERYLGEEEIKKGGKVLEKVNEIIYNSKESFDWEVFYQPVNALYDNFLINLTRRFPSLDKEEVLVCCLSKIGFDNTEIALLTKSNQNIIQKKKTSIRQKTGMKKQENFMKQLNEMVAESNVEA